MINDLDESLKQLLIQKAKLNPAEVDISFDIPTRDWSAPVTRPTVNLYLYDVRENVKLREMYWDEEASHNGRVTLKRRPVRVDLSYMVTCWTSAIEDQHGLLWRVLETFFRHSPLPEDVLQGNLRELVHPVRTEVAQSDGVLKNLSDFWGALENQLRPGFTVQVTLDLDLNQLREAPMVFTKIIKVGRPVVYRDSDGREYRLHRLEPGWEATPVELAGIVRNNQGQPIEDAAVRLLGTLEDGRPIQIASSFRTKADGRYVFHNVPPGKYELVIEAPGRAPQHQLVIAVRERGEPLPELVHEVEVAM